MIHLCGGGVSGRYGPLEGRRALSTSSLRPDTVFEKRGTDQTTKPQVLFSARSLPTALTLNPREPSERKNEPRRGSSASCAAAGLAARDSPHRARALCGSSMVVRMHAMRFVLSNRVAHGTGTVCCHIFQRSLSFTLRGSSQATPHYAWA